MSESDYAADMAAADAEEEILDEAIEELQRALGDLAAETPDRGLAPEFDVHVSVGAEDGSSPSRPRPAPRREDRS